MKAGGYLLHSDYWHGYLRFTPYDGSLSWPGLQEHAHVFSLEDARMVGERIPFKVRVVPDYARRAPQPIPAKAQLPQVKATA